MYCIYTAKCAQIPDPGFYPNLWSGQVFGVYCTQSMHVLCFYSGGFVQRVWCKGVIETYPRVFNTPSVEPLEGVAHGRACLPVSHLSLSLPLVCPRLNSGRHVCPMGGDWFYWAPSCLLLAEMRRWCSHSVSLLWHPGLLKLNQKRGRKGKPGSAGAQGPAGGEAENEWDWSPLLAGQCTASTACCIKIIYVLTNRCVHTAQAQWETTWAHAQGAAARAVPQFIGEEGPVQAHLARRQGVLGLQTESPRGSCLTSLAAMGCVVLQSQVTESRKVKSQAEYILSFSEAHQASWITLHPKPLFLFVPYSYLYSEERGS